MIFLIFIVIFQKFFFSSLFIVLLVQIYISILEIIVFYTRPPIPTKNPIIKNQFSFFIQNIH